MLRTELFWVFGLLGGAVLTAVLVNALAPDRRRHVRRVVILYALFLLALGARHAASGLGEVAWAERLMVVAELLRLISAINIGATVTFVVVLPRLGIGPPMIVSDILVGVAYIVITISVLSGHGLDPTSVMATSAVVSAILAISLQSTLGNILGGVALQLDGSIHEGDWVQLSDGQQGKVRAIRWRHTVVETRNWSTIIVPNAQLLANSIMILGRRGGEDVPQRMWVWFNVDYRHAPAHVIRVVTEAMHATPMQDVAEDPAPSVVCMDFMRQGNQSMGSYAVRYWLTNLAADDPTSSRVRARLYTALNRAGIPLAIPAQTAFVVHRDEQKAARRAKRRLDERTQALRGVHLFRSFKEEEVRHLAEGMSEVIYTAGEVITRQGNVANWLYILTAGEAEVRHTYDPDGEGPLPAATEHVAALTAPDFFGEMGLMTNQPREADVIAASDCECFRLGLDAFQEVLLARPEIAEELSERLAERKMELISLQEELDAGTKLSRHRLERDQILGSIKGFFGL